MSNYCTGCGKITAYFTCPTCVKYDEIYKEKEELHLTNNLRRVVDRDYADSVWSEGFGEITELINDALDTLTRREELVLRYRFGLNVINGEKIIVDPPIEGPMTLEEIGKLFNVTRNRIRQIESKALRKMRHPSRSKLFHEYMCDLDYWIPDTEEKHLNIELTKFTNERNEEIRQRKLQKKKEAELVKRKNLERKERAEREARALKELEERNFKLFQKNKEMKEKMLSIFNIKEEEIIVSLGEKINIKISDPDLYMPTRKNLINKAMAPWFSHYDYNNRTHVELLYEMRHSDMMGNCECAILFPAHNEWNKFYSHLNFFSNRSAYHLDEAKKGFSTTKILCDTYINFSDYETTIQFFEACGAFSDFDVLRIFDRIPEIIIERG